MGVSVGGRAVSMIGGRMIGDSQVFRCVGDVPADVPRISATLYGRCLGAVALFFSLCPTLLAPTFPSVCQIAEEDMVPSPTSLLYLQTRPFSKSSLLLANIPPQEIIVKSSLPRKSCSTLSSSCDSKSSRPPSNSSRTDWDSGSFGTRASTRPTKKATTSSRKSWVFCSKRSARHSGR